MNSDFKTTLYYLQTMQTGPRTKSKPVITAVGAGEQAKPHISVCMYKWVNFIYFSESRMM